MVAVSESEFQMPHRLSSSEQGFDFEVMMVLHVFLREVSGVQKLAAGAQFSRIDSRRFYSLRKSRNLQKLRLAPVPVGDRAVAKAISQKFQGLHRRAFLEFELQPFESGCEVLVLDRVSRNFYVDAEEIAEDFFFDERQVSDEGAQSGAAPTRFAEYFENQRMDIEKLNRLGKSTSFGFRFEPRELRKAPARRVRFSHNLHLRYSESLDGQGETEYFFDAFSPRVAVVCEGSLRAQNDASFQENLRASFGRPPDTCDSTFPGNRQFIKDGQKSPGKPLLDIDLLFALERARKLGARAAKVLSPENIAAFFGEMGSLNRERQFSLSIALYQNLNKFAPVEPVTLKRAEVHFNFRTDESKNVFLRIPAGNRDLNPLVLCSTLGGLGLGVAVILVAVFKKFKQ